MALNPSTNINMVGRITPASPDYPFGSSQDESSAGVGDGTPYFEARANDIFGFQQALLTQAGITPSGNADTALISQYLQALQALFAGIEAGWFNWVAKDAAYGAVSGDGILADTSTGAFTVTLPATPSVGDRVAISDATGSFSAENCTVDRNSSLIEGVAANRVLDLDRYAAAFVFSGVTEGWVIVSDAGNPGREVATSAEIRTGTDNNTVVTPLGIGETILGMGQTWQDVMASRAASVTYTNSTGRPIVVSISTFNSGIGTIGTLTVDGVVVLRPNKSAVTVGADFVSIVPAGSTYVVAFSAGGLITTWAELR